MVKKVSILLVSIVAVALFGVYSFQMVYSIEVPMYRNVFVDEGTDVISDSYVVLPYELLLHEFKTDTLIDGVATFFSSIVIRDKRTQEFGVYDLLHNVDVEYNNASIKLLKYSYSNETKRLYYILQIEQRRYQYYISLLQ